MKLNLTKLIVSVLECLKWPYKSPGTNNENGIDCSGLFVKAYRDQGASIYHGSNTIARKYCHDLKEIKNIDELEQGMAVFKWKEKDTAKYPDGRGDFCHIGMVTGINPLVITHASSAAGCVTQDNKIGKWKYCAYLNDVEYQDEHKLDPIEIDDDPIIITPIFNDEPEHMTVWASNGKPVKMRAKPSTNCRLYEYVPCNTIVDLVTYGDEWCKINYGKRKGWYMMTKFLTYG